MLQVPVINATRSEFSENGPARIPGYGSARTERGLRDLLVIDACPQVTDGTRHPAVVLTAGLTDPRVRRGSQPSWPPPPARSVLASSQSGPFGPSII